MSRKAKMKEARRAFREGCMARDGRRCVITGRTDDLQVHHITDRHEMPADGYVVENGITVCGDVHEDCEVFHRTGGKEWPDGRHPDDLYAMIGSSREKAAEAARRLERELGL